MYNTNFEVESTKLRQRALTYLKTRPLKTGSDFSTDEMLILIHELEVLQIELELQNEELIVARSTSQKSSDKYIELFDYAPTGYFTLSKEGDILELNHCLADLLGKKHFSLLNSKFGFFVSADTKPNFNLFLQNAFANKVKEYCKVTLSIKDNVSKSVYLTGIVIGNSKQCFVNVMDITENSKSAQ